MGIFLYLDSTLGSGSVALYDADTLLDFQAIPEKGAQAKYLVTTVHKCLESQSLQISDLEAIYCTVGPGGFTGIRIALAAAGAFSMVADIPVIGVSTLACMAAISNSKEKKITPILPASQGKVYMQQFEPGSLKPLTKASMVELEELNKKMGLIQLSTSNIRGLGLETGTIDSLDARSIASLTACEGFEEHHKLPATPLYIRPPDAALPSKKTA